MIHMEKLKEKWFTINMTNFENVCKDHMTILKFQKNWNYKNILIFQQMFGISNFVYVFKNLALQNC